MRKISSLFLALSLVPFLASAQAVSSVNFTTPNPAPGVIAQVVDDIPTIDTQDNSVYCPRLSTTFTKGTNDAQTRGQVTELQHFLSDYYDLNIISGIFGNYTKNIVIKFQSEQNLPAYGIVGTLTRQRIASICSGSQTTNLPPQPTPFVTSCVITTDKPSYNLGDVIQLSWASNGSSLSFIQDYSGKDTLSLPGDKLTPSGTQYINASIYGTPMVSMKVYGVNGQNATCTKTIPISYSVNSNQPNLISFTADSNYVGAGQSTTLRWTSTGADACYITGGVYGGFVGQGPDNKLGTSGALLVYPTAPTTQYNLSCQRNAQYSNKSLMINRGDIDGTTGAIRVTAPNGGEQWEAGTLNSITWAPYSYNPDINPSRAVDAYIERKNPDGSFTTLGNVVPSGKASIHWMTGFYESYNPPYNMGMAEPGQYYIRVVNRETGATDRSDSPFSITPKTIDLKINGSDGTISVGQGKTVKLSWHASSRLGSCYLSGALSAGQGQDFRNFINVQADGEKYVTVDFSGAPQGSVSLNCTPNPIYDNDANANKPYYQQSVSDIVSLLQNGVVQPTANLQILSPNGGEIINPNQTQFIKYRQVGLTSVSIALYKDDKWFGWIAKDSYTVKASDNTYSFGWLPSLKVADWPNQIDLAAGSTYKIYITGQKADGSGYVDDKSDATFSFENNGTGNLVFTNVGAYSYPNINNVSKSVAQNICRAVLLDSSGHNGTCNWNGQSISPSFYPDGTLTLSLISPAHNQNTYLTRGVQNAITFKDPTNTTGSQNYRGIIYVFDGNGPYFKAILMPQMTYVNKDVNGMITMNWDGNTLYTLSGSKILPTDINKFYFGVINMDNGMYDQSSAYVYLNPGAATSSLLNVNAWLEDPTGKGKETFNFGDQLNIKWSANPISDVELIGWSGTTPDTGVELRPYDNPNAASIRIVRTKATTVFPSTYTWNITKDGLYGDIVTPGRYYVYVSVGSKLQGGYRTGVAGPIWIGSGAATPLPTATLTVNGQTNINVKVGDTVTYSWSSTGGVSAISTAAADSQDACGLGTTATPWVANSLNGSYPSTVIPACEAGHTYKIKYAVTDSMNRSTTATISINVSAATVAPVQQPVSTPAPLSCSFNGQTVTHGASVPAYQSSISYGACEQQTRTCSNGTLSGSYTYNSCSPNYYYDYGGSGGGSGGF